MHNKLPADNPLPDRLRDLRVRKFPTMMAFSRAFAGTDSTSETSQYYKWENGIVVPNAASLLRLAELYNVSLDYLLGRTNNPHSHKGQ